VLDAVADEEHADRRLVDEQRHAQDRGDVLGEHPGVDGLRVREAAVVDVVAGEQRSLVTCDGTADPDPQRHADAGEVLGHRPLRRPDEEVLAFLVVERQVADLAAQQLTRAAHDRLEDPVEVAQARQVAGAVRQRQQLRLAALMAGETLGQLRGGGKVLPQLDAGPELRGLRGDAAQLLPSVDRAGGTEQPAEELGFHLMWDAPLEAGISGRFHIVESAAARFAVGNGRGGVR
jgi:hypothetical protein